MSVNETVLSDLKRMTILTGKLSSVHEKTLKSAPFIFFDNIEKVSISYDIKTSSEASLPGLGSKISFTIAFSESPSDDPILEKRTEALKNTVQTLLWKEVEVYILDQSGNDLCLIKSKK